MTPAVSWQPRSSAKSSRLTLGPGAPQHIDGISLHGVKPRRRGPSSRGSSESPTVPHRADTALACQLRPRGKVRRCSMSATISVTSTEGGTFATPGAGESHEGVSMRRAHQG